VFVIGLGIFTAASAAAALAPDMGTLIAARAVQGVGGAIVTPLSLTILAEAIGPQKRGLALGAWSAVAGVAVASGPVVGGAVVDGLSWQWIFWINVPIGLLAIPLARGLLRETSGERAPLDLRGLAVASAGLLGVVWGLVNGNADGWTSPGILAALAGGAALLVAFVALEARTAQPMVPLRLFRSRAFSAANLASMLMYFGMFGTVFLLVQFLQFAQGLSALEAGLRVLPWTLVPMFVAPVAGMLSDRIGGGPIMAAGLALQAVALSWLALVLEADVAYSSLVGAFVIGGLGNGLFFAPSASVVLGAVAPSEQGKASGINNALREVGAVFGVAVLASVFSSAGGYASPEQFVEGLQPAMWVGAATVASAALVALAIGVRRPAAVAARPALAAS
jgi:EmrB/QacA subfamily drug resistance transporter